MSFDDRKFEKFDNQKFARIEIGPRGDEVGILEGDVTLPALNLNEGGINATANKVQTAFNFSATDGIANQAEAVISFLHVPSNIDVYFKAFITTFSDTFSPSYNEETVFGLQLIKFIFYSFFVIKFFLIYQIACHLSLCSI